MKHYMKFFAAALIALTTTFDPAYAAKKAIVQADIVQGSESEENLIKYGHFEDKGALNVSAFADAAATTPVDLTGGSPGVTCTRSTSNVIHGTGSLAITHPGTSSRQGQGCSIPFSVEKNDQAKVIEVEFEYMVSSGTFVGATSSTDSSVEVYLYDVTNSTIIQPSTYKLYASSTSTAEKFSGYFQTSSNGTSYRLGFYLPRTETTGFVLNVDNIRIHRSKYAYGTPIKDWQSYTPTVTSGSGTLTNYTVTGRYRRVGDSVEIAATIAFTGSPGTWSDPRVSIPPGITLNSDDASTYAGGGGRILDSGSGYYPAGIVLLSATTLGIFSEAIATHTGTVPVPNVNVTQAVPITFASGDKINYQYSSPVTGWSSSVQMSDNADTRVVAMRATGTPPTGTITSSFNTTVFGTVENDTHGAYNSSTGVYTVPVSGYYDVSANVWFGGTHALNTAESIQIYKNNTTAVDTNQWRSGGAINTNRTLSASARAIYLSAGDTIRIRAYTDATSPSYNNAAASTFTIEKVSGPSAIAATEKISVRAKRTTTLSVSASTLTDIPFDSVSENSHGSYDSSTGIFTAPAAGTYQVNIAYSYQAAAWAVGNVAYCTLAKNGSTFTTLGAQAVQTTTSTVTYGSGSTTVNLMAGDTLKIRAFHNASGSRTIDNNGDFTHLSINRIGL